MVKRVAGIGGSIHEDSKGITDPVLGPCQNPTLAGLRRDFQGHCMTRQQVLDLYFMDARCKLIELAAFLDRVERGDGDADFRLAAFRKALRHLHDPGQARAEAILNSLSDPTSEPVAKAPGKGAIGAWNPVN